MLAATPPHRPSKQNTPRNTQHTICNQNNITSAHYQTKFSPSLAFESHTSPLVPHFPIRNRVQNPKKEKFPSKRKRQRSSSNPHNAPSTPIAKHPNKKKPAAIRGKEEKQNKKTQPVTTTLTSELERVPSDGKSASGSDCTASRAVCSTGCGAGSVERARGCSW